MNILIKTDGIILMDKLKEFCKQNDLEFQFSKIDIYDLEDTLELLEEEIDDLQRQIEKLKAINNDLIKLNKQYASV